jgi:hypothetical protein
MKSRSARRTRDSCAGPRDRTGRRGRWRRGDCRARPGAGRRRRTRRRRDAGGAMSRSSGRRRARRTGAGYRTASSRRPTPGARDHSRDRETGRRSRSPPALPRPARLRAAASRGFARGRADAGNASPTSSCRGSRAPRPGAARWPAPPRRARAERARARARARRATVHGPGARPAPASAGRRSSLGPAVARPPGRRGVPPTDDTWRRCCD